MRANVIRNHFLPSVLAALYLVVILFPATASCDDTAKAKVPTNEQIKNVDDLVREAVKTLVDKSAGNVKSFSESGKELIEEEADSVNRWVLCTALIDELRKLDAPLEILNLAEYLESKYDMESYGEIFTAILQIDAKNRKGHLGKRLATLGPLLSIGRMASTIGDQTTVGKIVKYDINRIPVEIRSSFQVAFGKLEQRSKKSVSVRAIAASAEAKLASNPDDTDAMAILGTVLILADKNIAKGADLLQKSRVQTYEEIGKLEALSEKSTEDLFKLASHWWNSSEKMPSGLKDIAINRSIELYRKCSDDLRGVSRVIADKRLKEQLVEDDGLYPIRIDLLGVNVPRQFRSGDINQETKQVFLRSSQPSYVQFEIPSSNSFDLEYRFQRRKTEWGMAFFFFVSGNQYMWSFSGTNHNWIGFMGMKYPQGIDLGKRKSLTEGHRTLLLKIRPERFEATLDGSLENVVDKPLSLEHMIIADHPAEMQLPYYSVLDWWGETMIDSAILTQYW